MLELLVSSFEGRVYATSETGKINGLKTQNLKEKRCGKSGQKRA